MHPHRRQLNRDASLFFDWVTIHHPFGELAVSHGVRELQQTIRERRFAMVDVGNDGEVPNLRIHHLFFRFFASFGFGRFFFCWFRFGRAMRSSGN